MKLTDGPVRSSPEVASDGISPRKQDNIKDCLEAVSNMVKDLQTEMLFHYHRLCIKNARLSVLIGVCKGGDLLVELNFAAVKFICLLRLLLAVMDWCDNE